MNQLVSVLNNTQINVIENRAHINAIQGYIANLSSNLLDSADDARSN